MKSVLEEKGNCYETSPSRIARVTFAAWLEVGDTMTSPLGFLFREDLYRASTPAQSSGFTWDASGGSCMCRRK